jgi:hypothetical protein
VLATLPDVLLMLRVARVSWLLSKLLIHQTKLSADLLKLIANHGILNVVVSSIINDLLIDFLLVVVLLVVVIILVTTVFSDVLMLAIKSWASLVVSGSIKTVVGLSRALVFVSLGIVEALVDVLVFILVSSNVFLDVILQAWFYHVVLINSDVLALSWAFVFREVFLVNVRV